jgi:tetratricopeptide (TPR) repeat protein
VLRNGLATDRIRRNDEDRRLTFLSPDILRFLRRGALAACALALAGCSSTGGTGVVGATTGGDDTESSYLGSTANLASLGDVVQRNPNDPQAYNMRGTVLARTGRRQEAMADFSRAIQLDPNYVQALSNRALVHRQTGRADLALADYNRAIAADANYAAAYVGRGNIYRTQNRHNEALNDYNRAIQISGSNAQAYHNRALVWAAQGNHRQAVEDFTTARGRAPPQNPPQFRALLRPRPQLPRPRRQQGGARRFQRIRPVRPAQCRSLGCPRPGPGAHRRQRARTRFLHQGDERRGEPSRRPRGLQPPRRPGRPDLPPVQLNRPAALSAPAAP